ncbi:MAG: hypothetical protein IJ237_01155 [Oscillospiraceae bacterium]|nr:hypothetical protein [Oscillospiraceae bacterium]
MKTFALALFVLMYILMIAKPKYRPFYTLVTGILYLVSGILPLSALPSMINWNVLMMISGTMILVDYFIESRMSNLLADLILEKAGTVMWATILMSIFAGFISAFIDNVATVLMVAPVGLPTFFLLIMVAALIASSFIPDAPSLINGIICCSLALLLMFIQTVRTGKPERAISAVRNLDFETLGLLLGLFVVIGGLTEVGVIHDFADFIVKTGSRSIFLLYSVIVWGSVLISAFVDNIPYVATMLPVLTLVTGSLGIEPYLLYFGLLSGATLGGNMTPIGASANIAAVGLLKKEGYEVSFPEFMRIGVPYTLSAVLVGYLYFWFIWA